MSDTLTAPTPTPAAPAAPAEAFVLNPDTISHDEISARYVRPHANVVEAPSEAAPETPAAEGESAADAAARARDERGRFVAQDADASAAPPAEGEFAPVAEGESAPVEGDAAEAEEKPARPKLAEFTATFGDEQVDIPEDFTLTFKVGGKEISKPLDAVIRMAQSGGYNVQLQEEVQHARSLLPTLQRQVEEVRETHTRTIADVEQQFAAILADPGAYEAARQAYVAAQSPEAQLQRLQAEVAQQRQAQTQQLAHAQGAQFTQTEVLPRITQILTQSPSVTFEEVIGKMSMLTDPLKVAGTIPPHRLPEVAAALDRDIAHWAMQLHEQRQTTTRQVVAVQQAERQAERTALETQAQKARESAHRAKQQLARPLTPAGRPAADVPPPKPIRTVEDAEARILENVRSGKYTNR